MSGYLFIKEVGLGLSISDAINKRVELELRVFDTINKRIDTNTIRQHELSPLVLHHKRGRTEPSSLIFTFVCVIIINLKFFELVILYMFVWRIQGLFILSLAMI